MSIIAWFIIGHSSPIAEDRRIGWNIKRDGWAGFIARHVEPAITAGARRVILHNPGGALAGEPMQFAQFTHARRAGLDWIVRDLAAWQPIIARGVEVIAYMGALRPDWSRDFIGASTSEWLDLFSEAIKRLDEAGIRSIALDAAAFQPAGSWSHVAAELLRSLGWKVYIEARPKRGYSHWRDYPWMILQTTAEGYNNPECAPLNELTGERIILRNMGWVDRVDNVTDIKRLQALGWSVAMGFPSRDNYTVEELTWH